MEELIIEMGRCYQCKQPIYSNEMVMTFRPNGATEPLRFHDRFSTMPDCWAVYADECCSAEDGHVGDQQ